MADTEQKRAKRLAKLPLKGIDKLKPEDMHDNTAVMMIQYEGKLYALGAVLDVTSDQKLYDSMTRVKNLTATASRTIYYAIANRNEPIEAFQEKHAELSRKANAQIKGQEK